MSGGTGLWCLSGSGCGYPGVGKQGGRGGRRGDLHLQGVGSEYGITHDYPPQFP